MSDIILLSVIFLIIAAGLVILFNFLLNKKLREIGSGDKSILLLNQNVQGMHERLDNAARAIGQVNKELGHVQEMGRQMKDLQDFLKSPKLRGNIGEQVLKDLLNQNFPRHYFDLQYKFKTGQIVDAILKTEQGSLAIDAKFPFENFQKMCQAKTEADTQAFRHEFVKDVKKHIRDISRKYILPEEGTLDFALMYVPSENIYYEILRSEEGLQKYMQENKVHVVSPNSFYYFLKIILIGLQGKKIEEASKKIFMLLQAIAKDSEKIGIDLSVLNGHLTNASAAIQRVNTGHSQLVNRIDQAKLLK